MRFKTAFMAMLAALVLSIGFAQASFADSIGYVDFERVLTDYDKAQDILAEIKVKEAELRKMQAEFVKQIEETRKNSPKNPVSANQLEKDLNEQLSARVREYRDWAATKQKEIDSALENSIRDVARTKGVDVVLTKQAVFEGGVDLTNDVLVKLNTMP